MIIETTVIYRRGEGLYPVPIGLVGGMRAEEVAAALPEFRNGRVMGERMPGTNDEILWCGDYGLRTLDGEWRLREGTLTRAYFRKR